MWFVKAEITMSRPSFETMIVSHCRPHSTSNGTTTMFDCADLVVLVIDPACPPCLHNLMSTVHHQHTGDYALYCHGVAEVVKDYDTTEFVCAKKFQFAACEVMCINDTEEVVRVRLINGHSSLLPSFRLMALHLTLSIIIIQ